MNFFSIVRKRTLKVILIACIIVVIGVSLAFTLYRISTFQSYLDTFRDNYFQEKKTQVHTEVQRRISDIDYYEKTTDVILENELVSRVNDAINIGDGLFDEIDNEANFKSTFIEVIRDIRFLDGVGYYFIVDLDGVNLLQAENPELEGQDLWGLEDADGNRVIQDLIRIATNQGQGFYEYKCTKPGFEGNNYEKVAYIKYYEPLNALIGTGLYHDDVSRSVKQQVYDRYQNYTYDEEGYLFVMNYEGIAKVFSDETLINEDVTFLVDADGTSLHTLFMDAIANPSYGDFVEYEYYKPGTTIKANKVSYVEAYPAWQIYIGTGFYMDDFENAVAKDKKMAFKQLIMELVVFILLTIAISILIIALNRRTLNHAQKAAIDAEKIYETLSELSAEGMVLFTKEGVIEDYNLKAKELFNLDDDSELKQISDYLEVDFNILEQKKYGHINDGNNTTPVEWYLKTIRYEGDDYLVLYVGDMSSRIDYEKKLEYLATTDMLTGLYNRRYFMENYHHEMALINRYESSTCIAMIDLDYFKNINDRYGHSTGDEVLKIFSHLLKKTFRESDLVARYGGEEFMILMTKTSLNQARTILLRFRQVVAKQDFNKGIELTFSAGLLEINTDIISENPEVHLNEVDELLYKAKSNGRNRIETPYN
ncbi:MAG: cache domain-containing protein [Vallitaleaceae bacterium]|jgi:diguanylate cyclase (GGDEF)-like protein|nr:cache domain-containing protein [Vallitaleaceae bacterium]